MLKYIRAIGVNSVIRVLGEIRGLITIFQLWPIEGYAVIPFGADSSGLGQQAYGAGNWVTGFDIFAKRWDSLVRIVAMAGARVTSGGHPDKLLTGPLANIAKFAKNTG